MSERTQNAIHDPFACSSIFTTKPSIKSPKCRFKTISCMAKTKINGHPPRCGFSTAASSSFCQCAQTRMAHTGTDTGKTGTAAADLWLKRHRTTAPWPGFWLRTPTTISLKLCLSIDKRPLLISGTPNFIDSGVSPSPRASKQYPCRKI